MSPTLPLQGPAMTPANAVLMVRCMVIICVLHICDTLTTAAGLMSGFAEVNPMSGYLLARFGFAGFAAAKALIACVTIMNLVSMRNRCMMTITGVTAATVGAAVLSNLAHLVHG